MEMGWEELEAERPDLRRKQARRAGGVGGARGVEGMAAPHKETGAVRGEALCAVSVLCLSPQDLAWMTSFYVRIFLTYVPLLGLKGSLGLLFLVR